MKKITFKRPDGGISVMCPAPQNKVAEFIPAVASLTEAEYYQFIINKDVPKNALNVEIVDESEIPVDRTNRNSWDKLNGKIEVDQDKVQAKADREAQKLAKRTAALAKLKITESDLADILKR